MRHTNLSNLTVTELLLVLTNEENPSDLEVALAERLEDVAHQLEDYEPEVKTRYVGE